MFRNESDLRAFASHVFAHYTKEVAHHPTTEKVLSPQQYRFAYLTIFGIAPSDDEAELLFLQCAKTRTLGCDRDANEDNVVGSSLALKSYTHQNDETDRISASIARVEHVMRRRLERQFPSDSLILSQGGSSKQGCDRDLFLRRIVEKYTMLYGPFRQQWAASNQDTESVGLSSPNNARLWALFDSIAKGQKGYFTLSDLEAAMARWRRRMISGEGIDSEAKNNIAVARFADEPAIDQILSLSERNYLKSVFTLCDTDNDGRVTFDQYKAIYFQITP